MLSADKLHVISVLSNPIRYESRARLFKEFMERTHVTGVTHWVVEAAFGEREYEIACPERETHVRLRNSYELWQKEALVNAGARFLPADAKYVMWADADIQFTRPDWATETLHALQNFAVVQPFSHCVDLGPKAEVMKVHQGFAYQYREHGLHPIPKSGYSGKMHPGYAWAWRRSCWDAVGGMFDIGILGAGDRQMANSLVGYPLCDVPTGMHPNYYRILEEWAARAEESVQRNIGHVPGTILHHFHGYKEDRGYDTRWQILVRHKFDPLTDITREANGLWRLRGNKPGLRDDLQRYFRQRNEDARR